jgi:predicted anti-sigma-YlaC factor YlaD
MGAHEIICREFVELLTDYLDHALSPPALDLVEEHLVICAGCRDYLGQFEATTRVAAQAAGEQPPGELLEAILVAARRGATEGA